MKSYPRNLDVDFLESEQLVSVTDPRGIITAVNDRFTRVAGCYRDELIAQHHNIARHPAMPAAALGGGWQKLKRHIDSLSLFIFSGMLASQNTIFPVLVSSVGRLIKFGRQQQLIITPAHRLKNTIMSSFLPNTGYKALEAPPS